MPLSDVFGVNRTFTPNFGPFRHLIHKNVTATKTCSLLPAFSRNLNFENQMKIGEVVIFGLNRTFTPNFGPFKAIFPNNCYVVVEKGQNV
jgi:hypothetical protein